MPRTAITAVVFLLAAVLAPTLAAQAPAVATKKGFSYCSVHDTGGHKVWATPVFEVEYAANDAWSRSEEMATDFHTYVGTLGGAGDKSCPFASPDRAAVEASRNEQQRILTQRFMGMVRANKWQDVAWTPKPWTPALLTKPAVVSKFYFCYGTDTDQRASVATGVFERSVDGADAMAPYTLAQGYDKEFSEYVVSAHGLPNASPSCYFKDTRAEAEKTLRDYRKLFKGFTMKFTDVAWTPSGKATASAPAAVVPPVAAHPASPAVSATPANAATAAGAKPRMGVRTSDVSPTLAVGIGLDAPRGALVIEVLPGSAAAAAGLKPMDVVLRVDNQAVTQAADLVAISQRLVPGSRARLHVWRERAEIEVALEGAGAP